MGRLTRLSHQHMGRTAKPRGSINFCLNSEFRMLKSEKSKGENVPLTEVQFQPALIDQVHDRLLAAIVDGTLPAGRRLTQDSIAEMLGVSRQPVSHAIQVLKRRGLLVDTGKRGIASSISTGYARRSTVWRPNWARHASVQVRYPLTKFLPHGRALSSVSRCRKRPRSRASSMPMWSFMPRSIICLATVRSPKRLPNSGRTSGVRWGSCSQLPKCAPAFGRNTRRLWMRSWPAMQRSLVNSRAATRPGPASKRRNAWSAWQRSLEQHCH
jgi:biotin operon repressor